MMQTDHPQNVFVGPTTALIGVVERIRVDQHLTQSMVFPVVEAEDRDHRARRNQHPNRAVHLRANARDLDLVKKDLYQLSEARPPRLVKRIEERDVIVKNFLPLIGKRLLHHLFPSEIPLAYPPVREWNEAQQQPQRGEEPT